MILWHVTSHIWTAWCIWWPDRVLHYVRGRCSDLFPGQQRASNKMPEHTYILSGVLHTPSCRTCYLQSLTRTNHWRKWSPPWRPTTSPSLLLSLRGSTSILSQLPGESVAKLIVKLRRLSIHYNFSTYLNKALQDHFVYGLCSETMQKRLLAIPDLLEDTLDMATAMEAAATNFKALQQNKVDSFARVKRFSLSSWQSSRPAATKPTKLCYCCGQGITITPSVHTKSPSVTTATRKVILHAFVAQRLNRNGHLRRGQVQFQHYPSCYCGCFSGRGVRRWAAPVPGGKARVCIQSLTCTLQIENKSVAIEVDTGADVSIISEQTHQQLFPQLWLVPSHIRLTTYTNEVIPVKEQVPVHVCSVNKPLIWPSSWLQEADQVSWNEIGSATFGWIGEQFTMQPWFRLRYHPS